jgi:peptide deformylase
VLPVGSVVDFLARAPEIEIYHSTFFSKRCYNTQRKEPKNYFFMILPLTYYGNPVLRKKALPVTEINDEIRELVANMTETLYAHNGGGLAAPQVGRSLRIFLTNAPLLSEDKQSWVDGTLRLFINPRLFDPSPEVWEWPEGCLSIPELYPPIVRPWKISVEAMDLEGNIFVETFTAMEARAVMHENDHINGVLNIDRADHKLRRQLEPQLREIKKKFAPENEKLRKIS